LNAYEKLDERRRSGADRRGADGGYRHGVVVALGSMVRTCKDGGAMNWLLDWWRALPSWAAVIVGLLLVSMAAATVVITVSMIGAYLVTRMWFWIALGVAVLLYMLALLVSNSEDDE
jgi:hypothetical protein